MREREERRKETRERQKTEMKGSGGTELVEKKRSEGIRKRRKRKGCGAVMG
jgi:hypothetical protein